MRNDRTNYVGVFGDFFYPKNQYLCVNIKSQLNIIRKSLLLFDNLISSPISDSISDYEFLFNVDKTISQEINELSYNYFTTIYDLKCKNIILDSENLNFELENVIVDKNKYLVDEKFKNILKMYYLMLKIEQSELIHKYDLKSKYLFYLTLNSYKAQINSYHISKSTDLQSIPICFDLPKAILNFEKTNSINILSNKQKYLHIVLNKFPIIDSSVPIKEIIEYKKSDGKQLDYLKLINWINTISKDNLTQNEFKDHLNYLLNEYEDNLKLHNLKYNYSTWHTLLSTSADIFENVLKLNLKYTVDAIFNINNKYLESRREEKNLKGNEIAYIIKSNELKINSY
jgi:hypothetical protein